jgi:chromosome segregation protein
MAAREAQTELYQQAEAGAEDLPPGARRLLGLDGSAALGAPGQVIGTLAEHLQAQPDYQKALEAALRAWLDAVVVADLPALQSLLTALNEAEAGSVRLLAATLPAGDPVEPPPEGPGVALLDHVRVGEAAGDLAQRLLGRVRVVESLQDLALPLPPRTLYVTRQGAVLGAEGRGELWQPGTQETNPLTRRHLLDQWTAELRALQDQRAQLEQTLQQLAARDEALGTAIADGRRELEALQRSLALCEGEHQVKAEEAKQAHERMETVSFELNALVEQQSSSGDRRQAITGELEQVRDRHAEVRQEIAGLNETLHHTEESRGQWLSEVTDKRVLVGERRQAVARCTAQRDDLKLRMDELGALIQERHQGVDGYARRIEDLQTGMAQAEGSLQPLEDDVQRQQAALQAARHTREEHTVALRHIDSQLHERRAALDELRNQRGQADVELAEQRMRRQNIVDRLSQDYHLTPEQLGAEPDPEWPEGVVPDQDTLETQIMEIRTKLESMGPVNLIAIEEHEELEERFQFLTTQQDDLVKAKTQLLDMIRRINQTTTEMFTRTFEQVNENFQETFKQLFAGGSAKLVLVDDAEVLESGIEIIARPPGKKLQSVSLLSGGERTMTAVALLFALYMVKPSPFCLLDELDAALDEANISRFVNLLERFRERSQFVVITHNRKTIEAADALYGVTMEKFGISKIMSVRFQPRAAQAETTEPTPPEAQPETQPEEAVTT